MTGSLSSTKISPLERAWLEEVGVLSRFGDDMTAPERKRFKSMAAQAVARVEAEFATHAQKSGLTAKYRTLRTGGAKVKPWQAWLDDQKAAAVRVLARQFRAKARTLIRW